MTEHAGCVARLTRAGWAGAVLTGASGVGKSDLMLRLLERGWVLVGDDRLHLWASGGGLYARAPEPLAGLFEARGLDVLAMRRRPLARVAVVVHCVAAEEEIERLPERSTRTVAGVDAPLTVLRPLEASAPAKVELALSLAVGAWLAGAAF